MIVSLQILVLFLTSILSVTGLCMWKPELKWKQVVKWSALALIPISAYLFFTYLFFTIGQQIQ